MHVKSLKQLIISAILAAGIFLWIRNWAGNQVPSSGPGATAPPEEVTARTLVAEYSKNEVGADERFKEKRVRVTGKIESVGKDISDEPYVALSGGDELRSVQLFFADPKHANLGGLRRGQALTAICEVDGLMGNVLLKDCQR